MKVEVRRLTSLGRLAGLPGRAVRFVRIIRQWIKNWNEDPKPFVWTKTAEDILQSLSKYIAKISDAGH